MQSIAADRQATPSDCKSVGVNCRYDDFVALVYEVGGSVGTLSTERIPGTWSEVLSRGPIIQPWNRGWIYRLRTMRRVRPRMFPHD